MTKVRVLHIPTATTIVFETTGLRFFHILDIACCKSKCHSEGCEKCPWFYEENNLPVRAEYIIGRIK
jgi:hypothetical protein